MSPFLLSGFVFLLYNIYRSLRLLVERKVSFIMENLVSFSELSPEVQRRVLDSIKAGIFYYRRSRDMVREKVFENAPLSQRLFDFAFSEPRFVNGVPHVHVRHLKGSMTARSDYREIYDLVGGDWRKSLDVRGIEFEFRENGRVEVSVRCSNDAKEIEKQVFEVFEKFIDDLNNEFLPKWFEELYSDQCVVDYFNEFDTVFLENGAIAG